MSSLILIANGVWASYTGCVDYLFSFSSQVEVGFMLMFKWFSFGLPFLKDLILRVVSLVLIKMDPTFLPLGRTCLLSLLTPLLSIKNHPCEICGDIGYAKDIVTCSKCQKSCEHIYCMIPHLLKAPKSWYCETCQGCNINHQYTCRSASARKYYQKIWVMGNLSSKVPDADIYAQSSGTKPKPSSLQGGSSPQMDSFGTTYCPISKRTSVALGNDHAYKSAGHWKPLTIGGVKTNTPQKQLDKISQPLHCLKSQSHFPSKCSTSKNFRSAEATPLMYKRRTSGKTHRSPLNHLAPVVYGVQEKCEFENALPGLEKKAGTKDSLLSKDYVCKNEHVDAIVSHGENGTSNSKCSFKFGEEDLPNPPAVNASWKGSFEIRNFSHELHVQAYPAGKVSRKVYLVSKKLPGRLQFTVQPRRDVWPETFRIDSPSSFDIGLYLCASDFSSSKEKYDHLLELMENEDLSMRSRLNGVELLVFTSRQLPVESQKMNKRLYLWGVFHHLKREHCDDAPCNIAHKCLRSNSRDAAASSKVKIKHAPAMSIPVSHMLDCPPGFEDSSI